MGAGREKERQGSTITSSQPLLDTLIHRAGGQKPQYAGTSTVHNGERKHHHDTSTIPQDSIGNWITVDRQGERGFCSIFGIWFGVWELFYSLLLCSCFVNAGLD